MSNEFRSPRLTPVPVKTFCERNPGFTPGAVRWHVFNSARNGLDAAGAVRRIGKRVYLIEERFIDWIDRSGNPAKRGAA